MSNLAPTARLMSTTTSGYAPLPVVFDASGSTDPEGGALTYSIEFGDGTSSSGGPSFSTTYRSPGTYQARLTVTDSAGLSSTSTLAITVADGPVANKTATIVSLTARKARGRVRIDAQISDSSGGPVAKAVVTGNYSGLLTESVTVTTASDGRIAVVSPKVSGQRVGSPGLCLGRGHPVREHRLVTFLPWNC